MSKVIASTKPRLSRVGVLYSTREALKLANRDLYAEILYFWGNEVGSWFELLEAEAARAESGLDYVVEVHIDV